MTPYDFLGVYGNVIPKTLSGDNIDGIRIAPSDHRYLLAFWWCDADAAISPLFDMVITPPGTNFPLGSQPLIFTHALHGSLVNMGFHVVPIGVVGTFSLVIVEGVAKPPSAKRKR